jgi:predicted neutral ceramidase superfamily lipid hydrolase
VLVYNQTLLPEFTKLQINTLHKINKDMETKEMIIHWTPRILGIVAILFVSMFSLDAFEHGLPLSRQLLNFTIHLIPSYVLLALLVVGWKKPYLGGILFAMAGVVLSPFVYMVNYNRTHSVWISLTIILIITVPFIVVGILFMISHFQNNRKNSETLKNY